MKVENRFEVGCDIERTWDALLDVPNMVQCVPGAELLSSEGNVHKGRVSVRLGPVALKFNGTAEITSADPATHTARILAKGSDQQGRGNAGATTVMTVAPSGPGKSLVTLETDLQLSGMVAQYGRASGMIAAVSDEIISQFAAALQARLASGAAQGGGAAAQADGSAVPPPPMPAAAPSIGFSVLWRALLAWLGFRKSKAAER